jgi:hypothetical protein
MSCVRRRAKHERFSCDKKTFGTVWCYVSEGAPICQRKNCVHCFLCFSNELLIEWILVLLSQLLPNYGVGMTTGGIKNHTNSKNYTDYVDRFVSSMTGSLDVLCIDHYPTFELKAGSNWSDSSAGCE